MSKRKYEMIDLALFTLIAGIFEGVCVYLFTKGSSSFFLSISAVLGLIAMFRWGWVGIFVAPIAGFVGIFTRWFAFGQPSLAMWLTYTLGYFGLSLGLLFFMKGRKKEVQGNFWNVSAYYLAGYLGMEVLRALLNLVEVGSSDFLHRISLFFAFDLLNFAGGFVILYLAFRQKDFLVDMPDYLYRQQLERENLSEAMKAKRANPKINYEELAAGNEINEAALLDGGTLSAEDLAELDKNRRTFEGRSSRFDKENEALARYQEEKATKGGKKQ